jgi:hypothetical protein
MLAELVGEEAEQLEGVGVSRLVRESLLILGLGLGETASLVMLGTQGDGAIRRRRCRQRRGPGSVARTRPYRGRFTASLLTLHGPSRRSTDGSRRPAREAGVGLIGRAGDDLGRHLL